MKQEKLEDINDLATNGGKIVLLITKWLYLCTINVNNKYIKYNSAEILTTRGNIPKVLLDI